VQLGIASPLLGVTANEGEIAATPGHQKQQLQQQTLTQLNGMTSANNANITSTTLANTKEKTPMCLVNELARFNKVSTLFISHFRIVPERKGTVHAICRKLCAK